MGNYGTYKDLPILAELYDQTPGYNDRADRDLYLEYCRMTEGKIIELGCGSGRILVPAARAGSHITGVDISPYMLARCREKLNQTESEVRTRVRLIEASITDFEIDGQFQLAIIPFRPLQHLISPEQQLACLKNINRHLERSGRLVFDVFQVNLEYLYNPRYREETVVNSDLDLGDGRRMKLSHKVSALHRAEQYNDVEIIYDVTDSDGKTERIIHAFPFRYFFRYEVEHLLARCGFRVIELYGDFDRSPLEDDSPEMIFIAEKYELPEES